MTSMRSSLWRAENLLRDWRMARQLVESYGGRFEAFLQPVSFFSRTPPVDPGGQAVLRREYVATYRVIERKIAESGLFHSLVTALDGDEPVYTDFCHVVPNGNRRIAERIANIAGVERRRRGASASQSR